MKKVWAIYFDFLIIVAFLVRFLLIGNYEFVGYAIVLSLAVLVVYKTDKIFDYSSLAMWGFSLWLLMHMAGGGISINGTRLYDLMLINLIGEPYNILKYDQVIHAICYFVITLFVYAIMKKSIGKNIKKTSILFLVVMAGAGIGVLNEILEFGMVIWLNAAEAVGGYENTALDLVANTIGAIIAVFVARWKKL